MSQPCVAFWFRRDLRLHDNHGLHAALQSGLPVLPVFIFDTDILDQLTDKRDRRVEFIHRSLFEIQQQLRQHSGSLVVRRGRPKEVWRRLLREFDIRGVFTNNDYEPYAVQRDLTVRSILSETGVSFHTFCDQVIFEKSDVVKADGSPYTVFTPFKNAWLKKLTERYPVIPHYRVEALLDRMIKLPPQPLPTLEELGFQTTGAVFPSKQVRQEIVARYHLERDLPGIEGTTRLGVHLRFGTVSVRELVSLAREINQTWLSELIWREFFMMILHHFPHVEHHAFRSAYDRIPWRNAPEDFERWCTGQTGYPLVDAGMRELNETGFMHNRVRMVTASFLTKHLLIDWRLGERYFAAKLLDYDLSANNGNWQWAAGTGCDAAPYFRVFNPSAQMAKFDSDLTYVRQWVPEYGTPSYPQPMIDHDFARRRAVDVYARALRSSTR